MVTVTDSASQALAQMLEQAPTDEGQALRLVPAEQGYQLDTDVQREGDEIVEQQGQPVLFISQEVSDSLGDVTIDLQSTDQGPRLAIVNNG